MQLLPLFRFGPNIGEVIEPERDELGIGRDKKCIINSLRYVYFGVNDGSPFL